MAANFQTVLFVSLLGAAIIFLVIGVSGPFGPAIKSVFAVLALLCASLAFSTRFYTYIFLPIFKNKNKQIIINANQVFSLSPDSTVIIAREGEEFRASAFVKIPIYRSASEMTYEEKVDFSRLFSRIVSISKTPVRLTSQLYTIDSDEYIAKIRDKLNDAESRYQKLTNEKSTKQSDLERIKGEVTMWHNLFDSISKTQSHALITYAMVSAFGGTEEEATNLATQQAEEIAAGIGSVIGVTASIVTGVQLLYFVEPEYVIPFSTVSEQIRQKTVSEGL